MLNLYNVLSQVVSSAESSSETASSINSSTSSVSNVASQFSWNSILQSIVEWVTTTGIKILIGLIVMFICFKLINSFTSLLKRKMELSKVDKTIASLTYSCVKTGLKLLIFTLFISYIGIDTASIGAVITSLGVGISLAVQGSLSNFAGGIVIIVMKPFGIGDFIEAQDSSGTVEKISLFYTSLVTPDNKVVMIPNGSLANGVIINYSKKNTRRVDLIFSISYDSSIEEASKIIKNVELNNPMIFHTPEPSVTISQFADSSIDLVTKVWVKNEDYWSVVFKLKDDVYKALVANNINIPFNQLDVHVINN